MFGHMDKLEEMKAKVNEVSPCFCMAKWMHVTIHLMTGHTHSCYLPQTHKIPLAEIENNPSALHNTSFKKQQRKKMLAGERPEECSICWNIEDLPGNQVSDRHMRSVDSWTMPYLEKIKAMPWDGDINPTYVEVSFSSACNFKCAYCAPNVSSAWWDELNKCGPYKLSNYNHNDLSWFKQTGQEPIEEEVNPYVTAFWKWWPSLVKDLMFFRITGGEPLLSIHTFKVLEWLREHPAPNLELSINSNLGVPKARWDKFMALIKELPEQNKVKSFLLHTSIDTYGAQAEYIRNGLSFSKFEANLENYLAENPRASVAFMCTFNNLSVVGFKDFIDWVIGLRKRWRNEHRNVLLDIPHLQGPEFFSAKILTPRYRQEMESIIAYMESRVEEGYVMPAEVMKMKRIAEWMGEAIDPQVLADHRRNFYMFYAEHDRRRGTNFLQTFPTMADFWEECKNLALEKV